MKRSIAIKVIFLVCLITITCVVSFIYLPRWYYRNECLVIYNQRGLNEWQVYCQNDESSHKAQIIKREVKRIIVRGNPSNIPESAFANCPLLERVILPDSIKTISDSAFCDDTSLTQLTWPNKLQRIGSYSFWNTGLVSIIFPEGLLEIDFFAFRNLHDLREVWLPDSLKEMEYAFSLCPHLERVHLGKGLEYLGDYEFSQCISLHQLYVPNNITELREGLLENSGIERLVFEGEINTVYKLHITREEYPFLKQLVFLDSAPLSPNSQLKGLILYKPDVIVYVTNTTLQKVDDIIVDWKIEAINSVDDLPPLV